MNGSRGQDYGARSRQQIDASLKDLRSQIGRTSQEDVVIEYPRRLFMRSEDGSYWQITISDAGELVITDASGLFA